MQKRFTVKIADIYLFEKIQFPGFESFNQSSLMIPDLLQVVFMAGGQYLHHSFSVCKQLQRESGKV